MKAYSIAISVPTSRQKSSLIAKTNLLLAKQPRAREKNAALEQSRHTGCVQTCRESTTLFTAPCHVLICVPTALSSAGRSQLCRGSAPTREGFGTAGGISLWDSACLEGGFHLHHHKEEEYETPIQGWKFSQMQNRKSNPAKPVVCEKEIMIVQGAENLQLSCLNCDSTRGRPHNHKQII